MTLQKQKTVFPGIRKRDYVNLAFIFSIAALYAVLYLRYGKSYPGVGTASVVPMVLAAWLYGLRGGIYAMIFYLPLNSLLYNFGGEHGWKVMLTHPGTLPGTIAAFFLSGIIGRMRDLSGRIKNELLLRTKVEKELHGEKEILKETLERLQTTQSQLFQSEKMASVGQLAAGVAHEINNPAGFVASNLSCLAKYVNRILELQKSYDEAFGSLQAGTGAPEALAGRINDEKNRLKIDIVIEDTKAIIRESLEGMERIKKIVFDLKSFSHVDQDQSKPADINACLETTLSVVWNELKYKCTIQKHYGELPMLACNAGQLNQVFMNLLVNASQAIDKQGTISITTTHTNAPKQADGPGYITIAIADTGCGIAPEKIGRIFEPFYTTKEVGLGTGLGLSISYDIVKKHNGDIRVQSEPGKGTTFTITLPVACTDQNIRTVSG